MFYSSTKHHFDTMFVVFCVFAGAISHTISSTSKLPIHHLNNHHRASFIDFIQDTNLYELLRASDTVDKAATAHRSTDSKSTATKFNQQSRTFCASLSHLLSSSKLRFCNKHRDILESVLPKVFQLTKKECLRVTSDMKWNCSTAELLLDRSNPLAFTKEAALVRSILSASMTYLVLKACINGETDSCGCRRNFNYVNPSDSAAKLALQDLAPNADPKSRSRMREKSIANKQEFSELDPTLLDTGTPLQLTPSVTRYQGCSVNTAFADAFTRVFIDSDDIQVLNKANRILNEDYNNNQNASKISRDRPHRETDYKDLAYIRWTKSVISLHNNNVGRQIARGAVQRRCRCHGLSGTCQFKTCWDQLLDFGILTSRLRSLYLNGAARVEAKNLGSLENPDLRLARSELYRNSVKNSIVASDTQSSTDLNPLLFSCDQSMKDYRVRPNELVFLHESPDYCEPQPSIAHPGTKDRACISLSNETAITPEDSQRRRGNNSVKKEKDLTSESGSCEFLCCNRGYHSQLVLEMVVCNCRFKFCCEVVCEHCLRQRLQSFCL